MSWGSAADISMRVMRPLVITAPLFLPSGSPVSRARVFYRALSSHRLLPELSHDGKCYISAGKPFHLLHLPSPATMFILLSSPRSSSLNPGRGSATCSVWFADLSRSFGSLEFNATPWTHESPAHIYSAVERSRLQWQVILEYNADGTNKVDTL